MKPFVEKSGKNKLYSDVENGIKSFVDVLLQEIQKETNKQQIQIKTMLPTSTNIELCYADSDSTIENFCKMNTAYIESIFDGTLHKDIVEKIMASINEALVTVTEDTPIDKMKKIIFESPVFDSDNIISTSSKDLTAVLAKKIEIGCLLKEQSLMIACFN